MAVVCLPLVLLSGCAVGRPLAFTARSNSFCSDALTSIAKFDAPTTPLRQIQWATDRYTVLDKAVSELTDGSLPGGSTGTELRRRWLEPSRASLADGRHAMRQLSDAVHDKNAQAAGVAFVAARNVGLAGVDTSLLRTQGLDKCATLFTPSGSS
jgi:hypothetical protein